MDPLMPERNHLLNMTVQVLCSRLSLLSILNCARNMPRSIFVCYSGTRNLDAPTLIPAIDS